MGKSSNKRLRVMIQKFRTSLQFSANKAVEFINKPNVKTRIADMNREQLRRGKDALGEELGDYGVWREDQRRERGLQTEFIDLKFEGNFHESIYAEGELRSAKGAEIVMNTTSPEDWREIKKDWRFEYAIGLGQKDRDIIAKEIALYIRNELIKWYAK